MDKQELAELLRSIVAEEVMASEKRVTTSLKKELMNTEAKLREEIAVSEERIREELREAIIVSEARIKAGLEQEITNAEIRTKTELKKAIKDSEHKIEQKQHHEENLLIKYHDEYAMFLRTRIERLEEKVGIENSKKN